MKRCLVLYPEGGLCNRMRAICSSYELCIQTGRRLIVVWKRNGNMNCRAKKLFTIDDVPVIDISHKNVIDFALYSFVRLFFRKNIITPNMVDEIRRSRDAANALFDRRTRALFLSTHTALVSSDKLLVSGKKQHGYSEVDFGMLSYNVKPNSAVDRVRAECSIGIHIRRKDNIDSIRVSTLGLFMELLTPR